MSVLVPPPRLYLLNQTGHEEKLFCEDGSQRSFHNVAKNAMFSLVIGQTTNNPPGTPLIKFSNLVVVCTLVYDQNRQKAVEIISQKPMEYKLTSLQGGTELRVDARIRVLSSQFEGSLFCVYIQMLDKDRNVIPELSLYSHPIRVRSKIKSASASAAAAAASAASGNVFDSTPSSFVVNNNSPRKRSLLNLFGGMPSPKRMRPMNSSNSPVVKSEVCDDEACDASSPDSPMSSMARVLEMLNRIESRQLQQQSYMESVFSSKKDSSSTHSSSSSCGSPEDGSNVFQGVSSSPLSGGDNAATVDLSYQCVEPSPSRQVPSSFGEQFLHLMDVFSKMSDMEKQEQLYVIQNYASEKEHHSMVSLFSSLSHPVVDRFPSSCDDHPDTSSSSVSDEPAFVGDDVLALF